MGREQTAKLFRNGRSQAVRLPAEFRFEGDEVFIRKEKGKVILSAKPSSWDDFFDSTSAVPDNFLTDRSDKPPQKRKLFK